MMVRQFDLGGEDDEPAVAEPFVPDENAEARADLYNTTTRNAEYHVMVYAADDGYVVNYAYGAIGQTLRQGTKTPKPVDRKAAMRVFEALVAEKLAKGYRPQVAANTTAAVLRVPVATADDDYSIPVALLEPVSDPEPYIRDPQWLAQPKYDGKRMLLRVSNGTVSAQNRRGLTIACPPPFTAPLRGFQQSELVLDGEAVGEVFYAFDLLRLNGADLRDSSYATRLLQLQTLLTPAKLPQTAIRLADTARATKEKRALYDRLRRDRGEGIVFKAFGETYVGRRDASRMVKFKFWASVSVLVIGRNDTGALLKGAPTNKPDGKRSIQAALLNGKQLPVFVGDVSVPVNYPVPDPGAVAEVRYLYAFPKTNRLFQPQYEGERDDVSADTLDKLQYKGD